MKITQLIEALELMKQEQGDLACVAESGMDPSDLCEIENLTLTETYFDRDCKRVNGRAVHLS